MSKKATIFKNIEPVTHCESFPLYLMEVKTKCNHNYIKNYGITTCSECDFICVSHLPRRK